MSRQNKDPVQVALQKAADAAAKIEKKPTIKPEVRVSKRKSFTTICLTVQAKNILVKKRDVLAKKSGIKKHAALTLLIESIDLI